MKAAQNLAPRPSAVAAGIFHLSLGQTIDAWMLPDGTYDGDAVGDYAWNASRQDVAEALAAEELAADRSD